MQVEVISIQCTLKTDTDIILDHRSRSKRCAERYFSTIVSNLSRSSPHAFDAACASCWST